MDGVRKVELEILEIPIEKIKPYENNPRINDQTISELVESIKQFGFKRPLTIDENFVVVTGHSRLKP